MAVRRLSKALIVGGLVGVVYSFTNLFSNEFPEPKKPMTYLEEKTYENDLEHSIKNHVYWTRIGMLSTLVLYGGVRRDKKEIINYFKQKSREHNKKK